MAGYSNHARGSLITALGVLVLTPDTLMIRLVQDVEVWTVQFYRYMLQGLALLLLFVVLRRGDMTSFWSIGSVGTFAGLSWGVSNLTFTYAVQQTAVANVLVILAGGDLLFSAVLSYIVLGERIPWYTAAACLSALAAILLTFSDQLDGNATSLAGNISAVIASFTLALYFVAVRLASQRAGKNIDPLPCNVIAGLFVGFIALCLGATPSSVKPGPLCLYLVLQGLVLLPLSFSLLTLGGAMIPTPEVSMLLLMETLLGPVWVYLGGFEAPPRLTLYGGILLVLTIAGHSIYALRADTGHGAGDKGKEDEGAVELAGAEGEGEGDAEEGALTWRESSPTCL